MTATTPIYALPYPETADPPDGPGQIGALAEAVEAAVAAAVATRGKGVVGSTPIGTSSDVGTTEVITNTVTFTAEADRAYRVNVVTPVLDNQGTASQTAVVTIRWAYGATVTNGAALVGKAVGNVPPTTGSTGPGSAAETTALLGYINDPTAGQVTVGVGLAAASASSDVRFLASGTTGPACNGVFVVEDVGPAY